MLGATKSADAAPAARINWRLVNMLDIRVGGTEIPPTLPKHQKLVCTVTWNVRGAPMAYSGNVVGVVEKRLVATLPR